VGRELVEVGITRPLTTSTITLQHFFTLNIYTPLSLHTHYHLVPSTSFTIHFTITPQLSTIPYHLFPPSPSPHNNSIILTAAWRIWGEWVVWDIWGYSEGWKIVGQREMGREVMVREKEGKS